MCNSLNSITFVRFKVWVILKVLSNIWVIPKCLLCLVSQWSGNFASTWLLSKPSGSFQVRIENIIVRSTSPPKMSATSSATTSVVWDWVPTDEANLHTHMCIFILTKKMALYLMSPLSWRKTSSKFASGWDTLTPWMCSTIQWLNQSCCFEQDMICNMLHVELLKQWSYVRKPLP